MDAEKNLKNEDLEVESEPTSFKAKRDQWESEWKAEFKRDWEKSWKNEWKGEWKKYNSGKRHSRPNAAVKLEVNGQTYSLSVGKIILGIVLLSILPFNMVLVGGAVWAAYHFGRRSVEQENDESGKSKRDEDVTAA